MHARTVDDKIIDMKRIILFVLTNLAVMFALTVAFHVICALIGPEDLKSLNRDGIDYGTIMVFAVVFGMGGAVISLLLSKPIAKMSVHARTITGSEGPQERWVVQTVEDLARRANVKTPEVAIYQGSANAFATGAFKNSALVAVSTDIMEQMSREELRAVLGHEMSHVMNGDMVTLTLVQGVLNSCVLFLSRVVGILAEDELSGEGEGRRRGYGIAYFLVCYVMQIVLGILASMVVCAYSRRREFAADAGSARLIGTQIPMIEALRRLGNLKPGVLPDSLKAMGISGKSARNLFATHPPLEARIDALMKWTPT